MIKAILFDMDGTLVNTETLSIDVAILVCNDLGIKLNKDEQKDFIGITAEDFYKHLIKKRKLNINIKEVSEKQFKIYEDLLNQKLKPFSGAIDLLKKIKQLEYKIGLVSGSTKSQIDIIIRKLKINKYFDIVVSCNDVNNGKPEPESYLIAAKKLNILPEQCIVVEDAEAGIIAAKNAGMKVIGVRNGNNQNLGNADLVLTDLTKLLNIKEILKNKIYP